MYLHGAAAYLTTHVYNATTTIDSVFLFHTFNTFQFVNFYCQSGCMYVQRKNKTIEVVDRKSFLISMRVCLSVLS